MTFDSAATGFGPVPTFPGVFYGKPTIHSGLTGSLPYGPFSIVTGVGTVGTFHPVFAPTTPVFIVNEGQTNAESDTSTWTHSISITTRSDGLHGGLDALADMLFLNDSQTVFDFAEESRQTNPQDGTIQSGIRFEGTAVISALSTPEPGALLLTASGLLLLVRFRLRSGQ